MIGSPALEISLSGPYTSDSTCCGSPEPELRSVTPFSSAIADLFITSPDGITTQVSWTDLTIDGPEGLYELSFGPKGECVNAPAPVKYSVNVVNEC